MSEQIESIETKYILVFFQCESPFNVDILLNKNNDDVWSQLIEIHITE